MVFSDMKAFEKWGSIPSGMQDVLLRDVHCSDCGDTTMEDYTVHDDELGIELRGSCKNCGESVSKFVRTHAE